MSDADADTERQAAMRVGRGGQPAGRETFVIVGAGLAGAKAAETLRAEGFTGRVLLVGDEPDRPYERPPLSKGYLTGSEPRESAFVHEPDWYRQHEVELCSGTRATMLDTAEHLLTLDGYQPVRYDQLLLATGARVRALPVPGADLPGVRYLRTLDDADTLLARFRQLGTGGRAVVVGGGWIGLEAAAAAVAHGLSVDLVEPEPAPLRHVVGDELGRFFADVHREHGVRLHLGGGVSQIRGGTDGVGSVVLTDGDELPADVVVVGVGVQPCVELAQAGGLAVDNGIVTDQHLRTSAQDVYACGDVANALRPWLGRRIRVEHWSNALDSGPVAARAMLGADVVYDQVPFFFSDQYDIGLEYAGYLGDAAAPGAFDEVVYRGDVAAREFVAFWLCDGRVRAGMNVNVWDVNEHIQALVRSAARVDRASLADPDTALVSLAR